MKLPSDACVVLPSPLCQSVIFLLAFYRQLPRSFTLTQCVAWPSRTPRKSCSKCGTDMESGGSGESLSRPRRCNANQPLKITFLVRSQSCCSCCPRPPPLLPRILGDVNAQAGICAGEVESGRKGRERARAMRGGCKRCPVNRGPKGPKHTYIAFGCLSPLIYIFSQK